MADEYRRCAGETAAGAHCKSRAMRGSEYCYNHEPSRAIERREAAIKAGRAGGRGRPRSRSKELAEVKQGVRSVITGVYDGQLDKGSAAVMLQGLNTLLRAVEMEHTARESEQYKRRLEELEERLARSPEHAREPSPADVAVALSERVEAEAIAAGEPEEAAKQRAFEAGMEYLNSLPDGAAVGGGMC